MSPATPAAATTAEVGPPTWGRPSRRRVVLATGGFAAVVVAYAWFVADPVSAGAYAFLVVSVANVVAIMAGPVVHRARPRHVWNAQKAACAVLPLSFFSGLIPVRIGPLSILDILCFCAYLLLALWLSLLWRQVGGGSGAATFLDTAALTVGMALALWILVLGPLVGGSQLPAALVGVLYPTIDVLFLVLCVHLGLRLGFFSPSLIWLIGGLGCFFALDVYTALSHTMSVTVQSPAVMAGYLFGLYGLAMSSTHPSVVTSTRRAAGRHRRDGRRTVLILVSITPAVLATAIPISGPADSMVRTGLVLLILVLLFVRLSKAMTALARAEAASHERATHDQLTGLLNRAALFEALTTRLGVDRDRDRATALLFLDCDDFKHVNDTWGHRAGDTLLVEIATRLPGVLGPADVLARHGGDEFVIVSSVGHPDEAEALAQRIRRAFDEPVRLLDGRVHTVTPSIGVAVAGPDDDASAEELIGRADVAMYEAKDRGRARYVVFDEELARRTRLRAAIGSRLREAIGEGRVGLKLQPIMSGPGYGTLVGWEALARWDDPVLGEVPPEHFVPVAEQLGLICDLGEVVLRAACRDLANLRRELARDELVMSINVSPAQLLQPDFGGEVRRALDAAGLPPDSIWLEVTETLLVDEGPATRETLDGLRAAGVRIVIDDFGTGYASLATLLRLPVDCVKIDRSLVARLGSDDDAFRQLGAVLDLVRSLGIEAIVAEGVGDPAQVDALVALGCPMAQGWLFGRPCSVRDVPAAVGAATEVAS
ncbi:putative bifunctional diguanylate cyclase/phosphodiesterase [Agilicoccus flavus]|uniref:putative bifunctional diguanylate cyclase/phosphodiesterase n=1 Tax=Agilicoccus flavus TaxID=2775968 RepID=UPI001CF6725D|nr:EAL domain-containing protein [Agilicoccus flavus]